MKSCAQIFKFVFVFVLVFGPPHLPHYIEWTHALKTPLFVFDVVNQFLESIDSYMVFSLELFTLVQEPHSEIYRVMSCTHLFVIPFTAECLVFCICNCICNFCSMPTNHITHFPQKLIFFIWCHHPLFVTLSSSSAHMKRDHISSHIIGFVKIPWKWGKFEEGPLFVDTPIPTYN